MRTRFRLGVYPRLIIVASVAWLIGAAAIVGYPLAGDARAAAEQAASDCVDDRARAEEVIRKAKEGDHFAQLFYFGGDLEDQLRRNCNIEADQTFATEAREAVKSTARWSLLPLPVFWLLAAAAAWARTWVLAGRDMQRNAG